MPTYTEKIEKAEVFILNNIILKSTAVSVILE